MTKTSQWAGYFASFFAIAFFITALEFRGSGGQVPGWFAVVTGWFMMLSAFSGVVCLVSAAFGFVRNRKKNTARGQDIVKDDKPAD
jgi:hypothetical protein